MVFGIFCKKNAFNKKFSKYVIKNKFIIEFTFNIVQQKIC